MSAPSDEKTRWLDHKRNVDRVYYGLWAICIAVVLADFFYHKHVHYAWEELPGSYAFYGLVSCVVLVILAKELRKLIMRGEDYYDPPEDEREP